MDIQEVTVLIVKFMAGWTILGFVVGLLVGPTLRRNGEKYPDV